MAPAGSETKKAAKRPPSLEELGDDALARLYQTAEVRKLPEGAYLIREGDTDQTAYIILDGLIRVTKNVDGRVEEIAVLKEGDWVGEIALTRQVRRTASAAAHTPAAVMVVTPGVLEALDEKTQLFFYRKLNELAAERIADLAERESHLNRRNRALADYLYAARGRDRPDYSGSEMIQGIVRKIPRLPAFAADLVTRLMDENTAPGEVAESIKNDPALSALVLKTVNSSYYGFRNKVGDIHHAVVLLGFNEVYRLVAAEGIRRTMPQGEKYRRLHAHSIAVSHLAFAVSRVSGTARPTEVSTIGLLHDLGAGVIELLKDKNPGLSLLIEGLDSAALGSYLLRRWDLPDKAARTVAHRFDPEFSRPESLPPDVMEEATVLYMAHLAEGFLSGRRDEELPLAFVDDYMRVLGWTGDTLAQAVDKRLLPGLAKKMATYPADFRRLILPHLGGHEV